MNKKDKTEELLTRGVEKIIDKKNLEKRLSSGEVLRVKFGVDPTGSNIHIGRATQLLKLRDFQELGHKIVLIIGNFTALIGDASDKTDIRPVVTEKQIFENMKGYLDQIGKVIDLSKVEINYNNEWFKDIGAKGMIELAMKFTAQQMIQRRNFKERWDANKPIGLHELFYPIFQGYDSVMVKSDVEMGGYDQLFNIMTGRNMQEMFNQVPQEVMVLKMIEGLDGRKMSTSWGNVININESAKDMFGKLMSLNDDLMILYFETCTRVPMDEVKQIEKDLKKEKVNPRDIKVRLAKEVVTIYHGEKEAEKAAEEFDAIFKDKGIPEDIPVLKIKEKELNLLDLVVETKLVKSKGEAKRLISQNAIKIGGETKNNPEEIIEIKKDLIIQIGKRRFAKIG
jgi:tyrosyl-tRNA synthetase